MSGPRQISKPPSLVKRNGLQLMLVHGRETDLAIGDECQLRTVGSVDRIDRLAVDLGRLQIGISLRPKTSRSLAERFFNEVVNCVFIILTPMGAVSTAP